MEVYGPVRFQSVCKVQQLHFLFLSLFSFHDVWENRRFTLIDTRRLGGGAPGLATHGPRQEVALLQAPLLPVEAVVLHVLLHHLVFGVEQQVAGGAGRGVLHVVHCSHKRSVRLSQSELKHLKLAMRSLTTLVFYGSKNHVGRKLEKEIKGNK